MAKETTTRDAVLLHNGIAALVLGYPLAIALSGILHQAMRALQAGPVMGQLAMWVVYPLWVAAIALVFVLPTRRACWAWLASANALAIGICYAWTSMAGSAP